MTLTYGATSVVLRSPEIGDLERIDDHSIYRESRHGEPISCSAGWPVIRTRSYTVRALTLATITQLKAFLSLSAGLLIMLADYNGTVETGYIVTDEHEIIATKDNCSYDVSFEFMLEAE